MMGIVWLVLTLVLWGILHSLMASLAFKETFKRLAGPFMNRFYRLFYNAFSVFTLIGVLAVAAGTPDQRLYTLPFPWSAAFILLEVLGVLALGHSFMQTNIWEFIGLKQLEGPIEKTAEEQYLEPEPHKLVTSGLYGYIRHPLYSAGLVIIWLVPVMTEHLLVIDIALTLYIFIGATFEERKLRREFGQSYLDYSAVTPMFIPFTKWNKTPRKSSV
ncbi:MAG TPA: isoprenylcysteine carboxylmethyltransferase family protein [Anaerolineales bacterium]|nr:isoprenylcysteine carboxylmethyltransferase family protein [Anaerolineales bacterium]